MVSILVRSLTLFVFAFPLCAQTFERLRYLVPEVGRTLQLELDFDGDGLQDGLAFDVRTDAQGIQTGRIFLLRNTGIRLEPELVASVSLGDSFSGSGELGPAADFDGDGRTDLYVARTGEEELFLLQQADGSFEERVQPGLASSFGRTPPQAGDLDGDGDVDLLFSGGSGPDELWSNDGTGVFFDASATLPDTRATTAWLLDADLDGDLDVVRDDAGSAAADLLSNDGGGSFTIEPLPDASVREVRDFEGDGDPDVYAFPNALVNQGDGTFVPLPVTNGQGQTTWLLDWEGRNALGSIQSRPVLPSKGPCPGLSAFTSSGVSVPSFVLSGLPVIGSLRPVDLDADGDDDLLLNGVRTVFSSRETGFEDRSPEPKGSGTESLLASIDLDRDGDVDVLSSGALGFTWLENLGDGTAWTEHVLVSGGTRHFVALDWDGDGDLDLAVRTMRGSTSGMLLLEHDGAGGFDSGATSGLGVAVTGNSYGLAAADFDGDGAQDLLVLQTGRNWILSGDGSGGFTDRGWGAPLTPNASGGTLGDLDGDGDPDVVLKVNTRVRRYENVGDGSVQLTSDVLSVGALIAKLRLVDFDQDGALDLLVARPSSRQSTIYPGDGAGFFDAGAAVSLPVNESSTFSEQGIVVDDLDGDGRPDIVSRDGVVFQNAGGLAFEDRSDGIGPQLG